MNAMRCQRPDCTRPAVVAIEIAATLAVRATMPVSLSASAHTCLPHVAAVAKDLARRVTGLES